METSSPPHPTIDLPAHLYHQLVYTLTDLLPPPLDETPEALRTRNLAAIAKVAALLPVNANEADLAAQCIAARAQAEDLLRLLRQHAGDIALVMRLNAQYGSMVRTSLSVHGRLMRVQAARQKREAIEGTATQDAWTLHVAERSMLRVVNPAVEPVQPATPAPTPVEAPAASTDHRTNENVSETTTNSHDAAFETWLSEQPWNRSKRNIQMTPLSEIDVTLRLVSSVREEGHVGGVDERSRVRPAGDFIRGAIGPVAGGGWMRTAGSAAAAGVSFTGAGEAEGFDGSGFARNVAA